tara:strand:+ start:86 stop:646 length:561 start_codon:yes stop_codon:yes gene_type:complete
MRIIGGNFKGKKINFIRSSITRPLKDAVKENIFNVLIHSNKIDITIEQSKVLDLYSGVGSFGLECISRGSEKVTFVEKNVVSYRILNDNLGNLSVLSKAETYNQDIDSFIKIHLKQKYNIFFFDPPFTDNDFIYNLKALKEKQAFEKKHVIIIHRERKTKNDFNNICRIITMKQYGRSKIFFGSFN